MRDRMTTDLNKAILEQKATMGQEMKALQAALDEMVGIMIFLGEILFLKLRVEKRSVEGSTS